MVVLVVVETLEVEAVLEVYFMFLLTVFFKVRELQLLLELVVQALQLLAQLVVTVVILYLVV